MKHAQLIIVFKIIYLLTTINCYSDGGANKDSSFIGKVYGSKVIYEKYLLVPEKNDIELKEIKPKIICLEDNKNVKDFAPESLYFFINGLFVNDSIIIKLDDGRIIYNKRLVSRDIHKESIDAFNVFFDKKNMNYFTIQINGGKEIEVDLDPYLNFVEISYYLYKHQITVLLTNDVPLFR
jgi:hypothetical protein